MGAFVLFNKGSGHNYKAVEEHFQRQGFQTPERIEIGNYWLWLYKKILINENNYIIENENAVFTVGTVIYKSGSYRESLANLLRDYLNNSIEIERLKGNYSIIFKRGDEITFLTDRTDIQNVYYDNGLTVISSSFLACIYDSFVRFSLNRDAALEVITTGSLIGPDTLLKGISRLENYNLPSIEASNQGIKFFQLETQKEVDLCKKKYDECLGEQINTLQSYFKEIKDFADSCGTDSGITGGHDSRLIMALALKNFDNISFHSHWRKYKDKELSAAEEVCKKAGVPLKQVEVKHPLDMDEEEMHSTLENGFLFSDGHIRMHGFWTEEYNTAQYREKILGDKKFGMSGIGGEQYRNTERMVYYVWEMRKWVMYDIILYETGNSFRSETALNDLTHYIEGKIRKKLNYRSSKYISHLIFKKYFNEVFIPARLGARNNAENRLSYFLSPFTDYRVSRKAYEAVNKLGPAYQFEEDMIKNLDPSIASVISDYGFDFYNGEPFSNKVKSYINALIPKALNVSRTERYRKRKGNKDYEKLNEKFKIVRECVERVKELELPVDIEKLSYKPDLMPLIIGLGYFLKRLEDKIL